MNVQEKSLYNEGLNGGTINQLYIISRRNLSKKSAMRIPFSIIGQKSQSSNYQLAGVSCAKRVSKELNVYNTCS